MKKNRRREISESFKDWRHTRRNDAITYSNFINKLESDSALFELETKKRPVIPETITKAHEANMVKTKKATNANVLIAKVSEDYSLESLVEIK